MRKVLFFIITVFISSVNAKLTTKINGSEFSIHQQIELVLTLTGNSGANYSPDLSELKTDFNIVSQSTSQSSSFRNGKSSNEFGWKIRLKPLKAGTLTIPKIKIGNKFSESKTIIVKPADLYGMKISHRSDMEKSLSADKFKHYYFLGITKSKFSSIKLSRGELEGLMSFTRLKNALSDGQAIDPLRLFDKSGRSQWLNLNRFADTHYEEMFGSLVLGKNNLLLIKESISSAKKSYVHWPEKMLSKYQFDLGEARIFLIPLLAQVNISDVKMLKTSKLARKKRFEVFSVHEFYESDPEDVLKNIDFLRNFILKERPDALEN